MRGAESEAEFFRVFSRTSAGTRDHSCKGWLISDHSSVASAWPWGVAVSYLVDVDLGLPLVVPEEVEAPHTDLTEVTRVVLIEVCPLHSETKFYMSPARVQQNRTNAPVVVLTTSETTTSGVLAVLSNTTVTGRDVAAVLASLGEPRRHFLQR